MNKLIKNAPNIIYSYVIFFNLPVSFYIIGRETAIPRDKTQDYKIYIKYTLGSLFYTPYYLYQNGMPKFGEDERW